MQPELQQKLQNLREAFAGRLPAKVDEIRETGEAAFGGEAEAWPRLRHLLHTLAGSAHSFGHSAIGDLARQGERLLKEIPGEFLAGTAWRRDLSEVLAGLQETVAGSPAAPAVEVVGGEEVVAAAPKKTVFLAGENTAVRNRLAFQIGCFGYDVRTFSRAADLMTAAETTPPVALVVDLPFPAGEGAGERAAAFRPRNCPDLPLIFISAAGGIESRLRAVQAGGDAFFTHPVAISPLIDRLDLLTSSPADDPYRILIVDDDPDLSALHALLLQERGMQTEVVHDPLQILKPLAEFQPDLILMDMYMPACAGDELARVIRQMEDYVSLPIVFLSSETCVDRQLEAMREGGDDFLVKPIRPEHLISSVMTRAKRMRALRSLMERDSLTGLLKHTKIKEQLELFILRARRAGTSLSFAMIDIDHFKRVNDTCGHPVGDRVIVALARLLQQRLRKTDLIGRYGGEEFAVILPDTEPAAARRVLDAIRRSFELIRHPTEGGDLAVTFSCGIAACPDYEDPWRMTAAADKALYEAKRRGRNQVLAAEPGLC